MVVVLGSLGENGSQLRERLGLDDPGADLGLDIPSSDSICGSSLALARSNSRAGPHRATWREANASRYSPEFSREAPTEKQLAHREQFRQAVAFGRRVMADPETRPLYEAAAREREQPVFSVLVADYFNAPSVDDVDVSGYAGAEGDPIVIRASDDFEVTGVEVVLSYGDGTEVERGATVQDEDGHWTYVATAPVNEAATVDVAVTDRDRPGGTGREEVTVTLAA